MLKPVSARFVDRAGTLVLAATLVLVPLVYSSNLADPFAFVKRSVMLAAAIALWGLALLPTADPRPRRVSAARRLAFLFLASAAVACAVAANRGLALWGLLDLAVGVGLFLAASRFARETRDVARLLRASLVAAGLVALGSLLQIFVPEAGSGWLGALLPPTRGGSTLGDPALLAQVLVMALPLGIGAAALSSGRGRQACGALLGLVASALLFAGRPEGWAVGLAALGLVLVGRVVQVLGHGGRFTAFIPDPGGAGLRAFLLAGIVMLAAASVPRLALLDPALKTIEPLSGTSLLSPTTGDAKADRAAAIPATGRLLLRHPLGVGPADFRHGFLEVAWTSAPGSPFSLSHQAVHAGNAFLEMAAETGFLGGLAFALLVLLVGLLALLATARAEPPWDAAGLAAFAAVGALIGAAFLGAPFQEPAPALLFWTAAGIVESATLRLRAAPAFARRLLPEERPTSAVRRVAAGTVPGVLWLAAVLGLGFLVVDRARASRWTLIGQSAYFGGRYDRALLAFDQPPVRRSPDHLPRALAASSNLRLARYDEAVREFGETLQRSPHYPAALLGRAAARKAQGLWDLADADYRAALAIWPDNGEIYLALAELDTARGRMDQALDDYRRVMQISPELADTYFRMGEIFLRRDQVDEAIEAYQVCGARNPKYPRVRLRLGDAFYRKGMLEMALRYYQGAAADDDKSVDARMRIANTEHALGHPCESQESLEAARDLESDTERREAILDLLKKVEPDCKKKGKAAPDGERPASRR